MADRGRLLGLDLGSRRVGVAVCDADRTVATPLATVERADDRRLEHDQIGALALDHDAVGVVVGLPLSLDGSVGPTARAVLAEVKSLRKRLPVPVVTHDERLSTVTAEDSLRRQGVTTRQGRQVVDQLAAAVILQAWIDAAPPPSEG